MKKAAALAEVLAATSEQIFWKGRTLYAFVSDNPLTQDLGLGGFEASRAEGRGFFVTRWPRAFAPAGARAYASTGEDARFAATEL